MKKSLLFAASMALAVTASAQVARTSGVAQTNAVATDQLKSVKIERIEAQRATGAVKANTNGRKKVVPANSAYYLRPKGTMYVNWNKAGSGYYMPFIHTKPYDEVTWRNASTASGTPSWGYKIWSIENGARDSLVSHDWDLTVRYGYEYEDVPALTMSGAANPYELSGHQVNRSTGAIENTFSSGVASVENSMEISSSATSNMLGTSHYFGSSDRFGNEKYGWTYYSGAQGPDGEDDSSGYWFGKNYSGFNVFGTGFEAPTSPYVLNNVYLWVTGLAVTADVDLECRVYRLEDLPAYNDTTRAELDPALLNEENLIATGRTTITTAMNEEGNEILEFTLYETDPVLGIEYETTPEINSAIAILILGMDQDEITTISGLITSDREDEGIGEHTFLGHQDNGVITRVMGLNNFFTSGQLMAGASIFVDVTRPFITFNYTFEEGEYEFPTTGGKLAYNFGTEVLEGIAFYATSPKADWTMTVDGGDVPSWLTITLTDEEENGEWSGVVNANVTCAALPAGLSGREATVRFAINGAYIDYHFIQGTPAQAVAGDLNGDGIVDVDDLNAIVNMMLGKTTRTAAADLNGDGTVDVEDMNKIINIMLGKN